MNNRERDVARGKATNETMALKRAAGLKYGAGRAVDDDARRLMAAIPRDTRSLTGRIAGDPLPGRSALDLRRQA